MGAVRYGELITEIDLTKLEIFGDGYISQYISAQIKRENAVKAFRYYVTDCLEAIVKNTANIPGKSVIMTASYRDMDISNNKPKEPEKTAEEIIQEVVAGLNKLSGKGE